MKECMNALANLGIDVKSWDVMVIHIMCQKLDPESRKQWEATVAKPSDNLPNLDAFKEFLECRFRSLEYLDSKSKPRVVVARTSSHHTVNVDATSTSSNMIICSFCKGNHKIINCKQFAKEEYESRHNFVQTHRLCFNCLNTNHSVYSCRNNARCQVCGRKHHSLLHPKYISQSTTNVANVEKKNIVASTATTDTHEESNEVFTSCFSNINSQVLLATALINAEARTGRNITLRCLLDQGSQASFITESAVQLLGLQKVFNKISVSGVGDNSNSLDSKYMVVVKLQSIIDPLFELEVKVHVLRKLTRLLPSKNIKHQFWPQFANLQLADPRFNYPNKIDLLLGAEVYAQILEEGLIRGDQGSPVAQKTKLGWILSGQIGSKYEQYNTDKSINITTTHIHINDNDFLRKFWEIEADHFSSNNKKILSEEEQHCEDIYKNTTSRDETGRYIVKLPFKNNDPKCKYGHSRDIATRRLQSLDRRLTRNPGLKNEYSKVFREYLDLGHMELIPDIECDNTNSVYLPHMPVIKEDRTTSKVRIVFDASYPGTNGVSLNNDLLVGPTLQQDLRYIIMRWRQHPICVIADLEKMYRQIKVRKEDSEFQRILWFNDTGRMLHYRMLRVTFGTASAPYLAVRTLQQLAYDEGENFQLAPERILNDFYIDDLMSGCENFSDALKLYEELKEIMKKGGFKLQKWGSNVKEFLEKTKEIEKDIESCVKIGVEKGKSEIRKVLGLTWNSSTDVFEYSVNLPEVSYPVTKRKVISDISRLFDPLGWISPVIIAAKVLIQKIWISGIEWDQELPSNLLQEWLTYRSDLGQIEGFNVPRWIERNENDTLVELHGFSDASNVAYSAVVYARIIKANREVKSHLITSKTKVSPIKQISIPRLELCGAVLVAKLLHEVSEIMKVDKHHVHAWTDSSIVLAWLSSHPSRWKTFIGNRVSEIVCLFDRSQWSHVCSKDNPADSASRGALPKEFLNITLWKHGPSWLSDQNIKYSPQIEGNQEISDIHLEERIKKSCHLIVPSESCIDNEIVSRFSSLRKLIRTLAYCRRYISILRFKSRTCHNFPAWLSYTEVQQALLSCVRGCQNEYFKNELLQLNKNQSINKKSKLLSLSPFLDGEQILRVGGRLNKSHLDTYQKHPILIPNSCHLAGLIVRDAHDRTLHGGPLLMLNYIRTKYWITDAKNIIKKHIRQCIVCVRHSAKTEQPFMGQLPSARVTAYRPFFRSGVDYAGPIAVRSAKGRGHHSTKGYICLFVCMATRAIHLEMVSDMTSQAFLASFKRFVARRGHCGEIWSDNGSTFVGAERELKTRLAEEKSSVAIEIADWLATNGTVWHKIPPYSPNFGGLWEAGIKSTKHHLKRIIGTTTLTYEEMSTVLSQVEACLNSRPLSCISTNTSDPHPLTPGHFLIGEPIMLVPEYNYETSNISTLKRWQLTQRMLQDFWRRWSREYLTQFAQRHKWKKHTPEPKIGDIVLVKEDDLPPARWLYGVIVEKHQGLDKVTRVVTLKCNGNMIKRPVSKLCLLPITE